MPERAAPGGIAGAPAAMHLRLYVAGNAPNSVHAVANARAICTEYASDGLELEIVDMLRQPERGLADGVIVTPTLLRTNPLPVQRLIGTLADRQQVLVLLGLR